MYCFHHLFSLILVSGLLSGIWPEMSWAESFEFKGINGSQANYQEKSAQYKPSDIASNDLSEEVEEPPHSVDDISYNLTTSLYTRHWNPRQEHNNDSRLIGLECQTNDTMWGIALFKNSFDQDSQLVYWAKIFSLEEYVPVSGLRSKWLFGLIHGYKGKYENKIPLNQLGIAPAIAPTIGITTRYLEADLVFLGFSAVTVTATLPIRF